MSRPSIKAIARECGVSASTVCRALNAKGDINGRTRRLILQTCSRMGYVPNAAATGLRGRRSNTVACIMHEGDNELLIDKVHHLKSGVRQAGYEWQLIPFRTPGEKAEQTRSMIAARVKGLIVESGIDRQSLHLLRSNNIPAVAFDSNSQELDAIFIDREAGMLAAMEHLFSQGRERILLLGASDPGPRCSAYIRAHEQHGIPLDRSRMISARFGRNLYEYGHAQTRDLLQRTNAVPDAIVAVNDACAIGAMRALADAGIRVPAQVAIIGFDDIMVSRFTTPALTTVRQPVADMACAALDLLQGRLADPDAPPRRINLKTELVLRESG